MSEHTANVVATMLILVGGILFGLFLAVAATLIWCMAYGSPAACNNGSIKEVAIALIGAVSALWGAHWLKGAKS